MSRNTVVGLIALVGIAAGTLFWRYRTHQKAVERQRELAAVLENTEENADSRIGALEDLIVKYPEDPMVQRVAIYQILRAHADLESDSATLVRTVERFLATDSSGAAYHYVSSLYAGRRINVAVGLAYANRSLSEAIELERPDGVTESQWAAQRRMMVGECRHVLGRLHALNAQPETALTFFRAARDSVADVPSILLDMARVYEVLNRPDSALAAFMEVVRLRYHDGEAREAVRRLYPVVRGRATPVDLVLDNLVEHARAARKRAILAARIPDEAPDVPPLVLAGIRGDEFRLGGLKGKVVVLYLWTTWCEPCQRQLPHLESGYAKYGSNSDVAFLAVSLDQRPETVRPFVERRGYRLPVALGEREVYSALKVEGLPTLIVVDPAGRIRFQQLGHNDVGDFVEELGWQIEALRAPHPTE